MLADSHYAIVYADGQYRILRVRTPKGERFGGKTIISMKEGTRFQGFGFLMPNNQVKFWRNFSNQNNDTRLARIKRAVEIVAADPQKAQMAFAMKEGKCARCARQLTVPASLHRGLGPECAGKGRWTQADNQLAFAAQKQKAAVTTPQKSFFGQNPARRTA